MGRDLSDFIVEAGLAGASENELLRGFCARVREAGVPLTRATVIIDTLHPALRGPRLPLRMRRRSGDGRRRVRGNTARRRQASWRSSAFCHLLETGGTLLRRNLARGDPADFARIAEVRERRATPTTWRWSTASRRRGVIGEMDCIYSAWTTDAPDGLRRAEQVERLAKLVPTARCWR